MRQQGDPAPRDRPVAQGHPEPAAQMGAALGPVQAGPAQRAPARARPQLEPDGVAQEIDAGSRQAGHPVRLAQVEMAAPRDGVAVFSDPNDWLGKPVVTGERIMLLADPATPAMLIHLPVADAISLDLGAPVKLYLSAHPLSSIEGRISETSYQAITTPDGVAAYRLRATIDGPAPDARLGLRGTAKVYGGWVVLGYYLLRRPLATLRSWSGF